MSREYTTDEIRERFLETVRRNIDYWEKEARVETIRDRIEGAIFSTLVLLDGGNGSIPGFIVAPLPHPTDKDYHIDNGKDYYPDNNEVEVKGDISGCLHELLYKKEEEK